MSNHPDNINQPDSEEMLSKRTERSEVAKSIERNRSGVVLTGQIKDGKVVLDQSCLDKISRQLPDANISFIAVNAPFDPQAIAIV